MIILKKKVINKIIFSITLGVILLLILFATTKGEKTVQTVALPVLGKTIILDAGHGGEDGRSNYRGPVFPRQILI